MAYILDADSLIKLNRVGALDLVSANLECLIPQGVYFEVVTKGRLYGKPDAEVIDLVVRRNITVALVPTLDPSVSSNPLGLGDDQVLTLGKGKWLVDLIVTDDRRLHNRCVREIGRVFGSAINFFPLLVSNGTITITEARNLVEAFQPLTTDRNYQRALVALEDFGNG